MKPTTTSNAIVSFFRKSYFVHRLSRVQLILSAVPQRRRRRRRAQARGARSPASRSAARSQRFDSIRTVRFPFGARNQCARAGGDDADEHDVDDDIDDTRDDDGRRRRWWRWWILVCWHATESRSVFSSQTQFVVCWFNAFCVGVVRSYGHNWLDVWNR